MREFVHPASAIGIASNIGLVLGGVDPVTRKYVGKEVWVKAKIARVKYLDKLCSATD
jgi:hypothetical protein